MRRLVWLLFAGLVAGGLAQAQIPTAGNVFVGYSYYNTNLSGVNRTSANGWEATLEGKVLPFVGIVADLSGHYGSQDFVNPAATCVIGGVCPPLHESTHLYEALFGPRISGSVGKFRPFGEVEVGVAHISSNGFGSNTAFATAIGGGLDYRIVRPVAWRLQADYVSTRFFSTTQNNIRLSTGIVLRF